MIIILLKVFFNEKKDIDFSTNKIKIFMQVLCLKA